MTLDELEDGLGHFGLHFDRKELMMLLVALDKDGDPNSMTFDEFLVGIRGELNERRLNMIDMAFHVLDKDGSGMVDIEDMKVIYSTEAHPEVQQGKMSQHDALMHLLEQFDQGQNDGKVTRGEFHEYYKNLSASVDNDDYFELMVRNAWHIPGGSGWCENTSNARVLVDFQDGHQEVVMIEQDLGLDLKNERAVIAQLNAQGVKNIKKVSRSM